MSFFYDKTNNFDTDKFIEEVQSRPSIWDITSSDYSDREKKKKCWEELVDMFINIENASALEKSDFGKKLQRRWKSLRDCYSRELQQSKSRPGCGASKKPKYMYTRQLSFLYSVIIPKEKSNSVRNDVTENLDETSSPGSSSSNLRHIKRKHVNSAEQNIIEELNEEIKSKERREIQFEDNDDRLFLLTLLKPMKKIPEHQKLKARMELMKVVERYAYAETFSTPQHVNTSNQQKYSQDSLQTTSNSDPYNTSSPSCSFSNQFAVQNDYTTSLQAMPVRNIVIEVDSNQVIPTSSNDSVNESVASEIGLFNIKAEHRQSCG